MNRFLLYLATLVASPVLLFSAQPEASARIDSFLEKSWKQKKIKPAAIVDDETFVRRIYLDAIGRIPSAREIETFLADDSKTKRSDLIDELLDSEGYEIGRAHV